MSSPVSLVLWHVLFTLGCAQLSATTGPATAEEPELSYTLRLLDGSPRRVGVTLKARGADDGRTVLAVDQEFGGIAVQGAFINESRFLI